MYEARIRETICIAHRVLRADGALGPLHGHNWTIEVDLGAEELDERGLVCDAVAARALLHGIVDPIDHRTLDDLAPFRDDPRSRTAPGFARWVGEALSPHLEARLWVVRVRVLDGTGRVFSFVTGERR